MNEIQLLRGQLEVERRHLRAVAGGCAGAHRIASLSSQAAALGALRQALCAALPAGLELE